jgi:hypothetical protein
MGLSIVIDCMADEQFFSGSNCIIICDALQPVTHESIPSSAGKRKCVVCQTP